MVQPGWSDDPVTQKVVRFTVRVGFKNIGGSLEIWDEKLIKTKLKWERRTRVQSKQILNISFFTFSMALIHGSIPGTSAVRLGFSTSVSPRIFLNVPVVKQGWKNSCRRRVLRAMVQETVQGSPLVYAREMERLSAKESLLLAV